MVYGLALSQQDCQWAADPASAKAFGHYWSTSSNLLVQSTECREDLGFVQPKMAIILLTREGDVRKGTSQRICSPALTQSFDTVAHDRAQLGLLLSCHRSDAQHHLF